MAERDASIDTLRGIACVLLVTMHVIGYDEGSGIHIPDGSALRWYTDSMVYLRMPLFSFLAGFVYAWRPTHAPTVYPTFMSAKMRRLLVPYVVFVPLIGVAQTLVPDANNSTGRNTFEWFLYALPPYWFLLAMFWIFAVVALLDSWRLLEHRPVVLGVFAALAAVNSFTPVVDIDFLQIGPAVSLATFFIAGLSATRFGWRRLPRQWGGIALAVFTALFAYTQLGVSGLIPQVAARGDILGIALGTAFPLALLALGVRSAALAWIGHHSSGIFLVHPFLSAGARALQNRVGLTEPLLQFAVGSLAGIFGSILVVRVMQRNTVGRVVLGEKSRWQVADGPVSKPRAQRRGQG